MYVRSHSGLGILPLVAAGAAYAGGSALGASLCKWLGNPWGVSDWCAANDQAYRGYADPVMKPAPSPSFQPPPAPQTSVVVGKRDDGSNIFGGPMVTFSPIDQAEALAQRQAQFQLDTSYLRDLSATDGGNGGNGGSSDNTLLWVAGGLALAVGLVAIAK